MTDLPSGTVTFLFTDIEGSTELWERWPDAMKTALARHHEILTMATTQHNGYVFQIVGDAFCVAFGSVPNALTAALEAQRALNAEAWGVTGTLRVRMALHTGAAEPQDGQYSSNRSFNRIARLLAAGYGGQILLTLATEELLRDHLPADISLRDLGERRLRDVIHPEHIFQAIAPDLPSEFPPLKLAPVEPPAMTGNAADPIHSLSDRSHRSPLVGRADSLRRMSDRLDRMRSGLGGMVAVSGEPGIGKSRVLDETIAAARRRGFQVLVGRCHELDRAIPYAPISEAVAQYARNCVPSTWKRLLEAAGPDMQVLQADKGIYSSFWAASVLRPEASATLAAASDSIRPARSVRNLLGEISKGAPVLLAVDDLHWADAATLELIHEVILHARDLPILLLGSYREVDLERSHPLSQLLMDLNRERLLVREHLRRFSAPETRELLTVLLSGEPPPGLAELIAERTEGNPFFIEELVTGLIDDERLVWDERESQYSLATGLSIEKLVGQVPQGIRAVIGSRLDRLDSEAQQTLTLASIIGRQFSLDVLGALAGAHGLSEEAVERALGRAGAANFIRALDPAPRPRDDGTTSRRDASADFTFVHALIHQVVYDEIERRERRRLHDEVGRLLEDIYAQREGSYAERIAYHYLESDNDARAVHYSILAGDKMLLEYYDADLALAYYLPALQMAAARDPVLRRVVRKFPTLNRHGRSHHYSPEERDEAINFLGEVLGAIHNPKAAKEIAQLASRICVVAMHTGEIYEASVRLYEQALLGPNVQKLVVESERGRLVGILEFPGPGGPYPLVLLCHGVPSGRGPMMGMTPRLLARGLATLCVDLPGYGETTVPLTQSPADVEALKRVIDAVCADVRIDPSRIGVLGFSDGGWHAAQLCARDERVRAMVGVSGRYNKLEGPEHVIAVGPTEEAFRVARWKAGARPTPDQFSWSADSSVFDVAHKIRCPMLLMVGSIEPELFRAQAQKLATLVPTAQLKVWRNGMHGLFGDIPESLDYAGDWLKQQLHRMDPTFRETS